MTSADIRDAYDLSAAAWAGGPERVYAKLAEALLAAAPVDVEGARVLDVGAGTGVAGRAALAAGAAKVVAVDLSASMLGDGRGAFAPVLADAAALPFRTESFDLVVAACCLSHLPDPERALREARRVGTAIVASAFTAAWTHPAKTAADDALAEVGYTPPDWYVTFKATSELRVADPAVLTALAKTAGYRSAEVRIVDIATGIDAPGEMVAWRLGMAHVAPFVRSLPPDQQSDLRRAAEDALAGAPPLVVPLVVLAAS